jgi:serine/threonine-protein kinase ATR
LSRWIQAKQIEVSRSRGHDPGADQIIVVRSVLETIPAELVSQRAMVCKSYSRALFYWEQHIRQVRDRTKQLKTPDMVQLQDIYSQIDEPDGIEGISAHLHVLDIDQQILAHRKAGRWTAAQSWYEIKLAETPEDIDVQVNLLTCLKESGQHGKLLVMQTMNFAYSWQMFSSIMWKVCIRLRKRSLSFFHLPRRPLGLLEDGKSLRNISI